jgi:hypothetical protein
MFKDRRASPRQDVNSAGSIISDAAPPRDCIIADISEGGVRISVTAEVPDEFVLVIKQDGGTSYKCRVVWRLEDEIGAEFI